MITITETDWQALIDEAHASIERLNAQATGRFAQYRHTIEVQDLGNAMGVMTTQSNGWTVERKGLARNKADGALIKLSFSGSGRKLKTKGRFATAKAWEKAAGKGPLELLKATGLVGFGMFAIGNVVVKDGEGRVIG
jgi:hypothetical protein